MQAIDMERLLSVTFDDAQRIPSTNRVVVELNHEYMVYDLETSDKLLDDKYSNSYIAGGIAVLSNNGDNELVIITEKAIKHIDTEEAIQKIVRFGQCFLIYLHSNRIIGIDGNGDIAIDYTFSTINFGDKENTSSKDPIISISLTNGVVKIMHSSGKITDLVDYLRQKFEIVYWINKHTLVGVYKDEKGCAVIEASGTIIRDIPYSEFNRIVNRNHLYKKYNIIAEES